MCAPPTALLCQTGMTGMAGRLRHLLHNGIHDVENIPAKTPKEYGKGTPSYFPVRPHVGERATSTLLAQTGPPGHPSRVLPPLVSGISLSRSVWRPVPTRRAPFWKIPAAPLPMDGVCRPRGHAHPEPAPTRSRHQRPANRPHLFLLGLPKVSPSRAHLWARVSSEGRGVLGGAWEHRAASPA